MDINTILTLVKAGYSKDEITQLEQQTTANTDSNPVQPAIPQNTPAAEPAMVEEPVVKPDAAPVPAAQAAPAPVPAAVPVQPVQEQQPTMTDIMQSIANLTRSIQANAIAQSTIPGAAMKQNTAEDMIAEIIRPTYKGGER